MTISNNLVNIKNNKVLTTSLLVAEKFEKEHSKILKDIKILLEKINETKIGLINFFYINDIIYKNPKGEQRLVHEFDKDFFNLLVTSFTGEKALKFKIKYIQAFNKME